MSVPLTRLASILLLRPASCAEVDELRRTLHVLQRYATLLIGVYLLWVALTTVPALFRDRPWPYYVTALLFPQLVAYGVASSAARAWIDLGDGVSRTAVVTAFLIGALGGAIGMLIGYADSAWGGNSVQLWFVETFNSIWWVVALVFILSLWPEMVGRQRKRERRQLERLAQAQAQVERAARAGAEAELRLLQTQVEPHFLYNTLANVRYLIESGSPDALRMTDALIEYLRASVPNMRAHRVTLGHEADQVRHYLSIMQMRMQGRLTYEVDVPPELCAIELPPLVLLTLVENAIKHGVAPAVDGGAVHVRARRDGERLRIDVADTGVGLADRTSAPQPSTRAGLANARERLRLTYQDRAELTLGPNAPRGACAQLSVPTMVPVPVPESFELRAPQTSVAEAPAAALQPLRHCGPTRTWEVQSDGIAIRVVDSWFGGCELWVDGRLHDVYTKVWTLPPDEPVLHAAVTGASGTLRRIGVQLQVWSFSIRAAIFVDGTRVAGDAI